VKPETVQDLPEDLAGRLGGRRAARQRAALGAMRGLDAAARGLGLGDIANALAEAADGLESENFRIIVMGRFKNGKSTLLNALMGGTTRPVSLNGAHGPMVVDDLPATAVLSEVSYADTPFIRAWKMDERAENWTLAQYLANSTLGDDNEENERRFAGLRQFEIGFPARLCASKVTLYDSPGLDENPLRTRITLDAVRRCDTALMVFGTRALMGEGELLVDRRVREDGTRVFVVVNLFDGRPADDRLRASVWKKYVRDQLGGPDWAGQDPADYDIYFVDAKRAADARYGPPGPAADQAYRDCGLAALEERLGRFLIDERLATHLGAFVTRAVNHADAIAQQVSQRQAAAVADRDKFRAAWAEQQAPLTELRARPGRLPKIVDRYRLEAIVSLTASAGALIASLRQELPAHLAAAALPTEGARLPAVWQQKKLMREAVDEVNAFIAKRIAEWSEREAVALLEATVAALTAEISEEVAQIGRGFDAVAAALTGWDVELGTPGSVFSRTERIAAAITGMIFGDLSAAVGGGQGGWRGAIGGIAGAGAASWLLIGVLGITSAVVFVPILAAAALFAAVGGSMGLVEKIKKKALDAADAKLALLPTEISARLTDALTARFAEVETAITEEVTGFIEEQARGIEEQVRISQQNEADQDRTLRDLKRAALEVAAHRETLTATKES
jgi:hypothetical protein